MHSFRRSRRRPPARGAVRAKAPVPACPRPPSLLAEALASSRRHETRSDRQSGYRRAIPFRALRSSDRPRPGPSLPWQSTRAAPPIGVIELSPLRSRRGRRAGDSSRGKHLSGHGVPHAPGGPIATVPLVYWTVDSSKHDHVVPRHGSAEGRRETRSPGCRLTRRSGSHRCRHTRCPKSSISTTLKSARQGARVPAEASAARAR